MLTFGFILIVYFTTATGREVIQATVMATSLERCNVTRSMTMQALPHMDGWAGKCKKLDVPVPILPEQD